MKKIKFNDLFKKHFVWATLSEGMSHDIGAKGRKQHHGDLKRINKKAMIKMEKVLEKLENNPNKYELIESKLDFKNTLYPYEIACLANAQRVKDIFIRNSTVIDDAKSELAADEELKNGGIMIVPDNSKTYKDIIKRSKELGAEDSKEDQEMNM